MDAQQITDAFLKAFRYEPTPDQMELIEKLSRFLIHPQENNLFLLKGYAGTGKTTVVSNLVRVLPVLKASCVLLAPTGRAAKVLAGYAQKPAFTIHKAIYRLKNSSAGGMSFNLLPNKHKNTLFLVDEASMISDSGEDQQMLEGRSLLDDLIRYVYSGDNCRLILIGDTAQLPPVKMDQSPALSEGYLRAAYHLEVWSSELREVVRQAGDSGILYNATLVRHKIAQGDGGFIPFQLSGYRDIYRMQGPDAADLIAEAFSGRDLENSIVVCRSNKRANLYNQHIRSRFLFFEDEIAAGDLLMVVRNNYFWLPKESQAGFIANGDIAEVKRVQRIEEMYGFRFARITARLIDYPDEPDLEVLVMMDTLTAEGPALSSQEHNRLYEEVARDYEELPTKKQRLEKVKANPWYNALQVKFAYAMTCHKSQGGQWEKVFVEMGYIPEKQPDHAYYRWLYTALTRATQELYLMGFSDDFFETE